MNLLLETLGLDSDATRLVIAWWRLRRIRKARARKAYERFRAGSLPAPRAEIANLTDVEKQLPRLTGFTWHVYREYDRFQYRIILRQDGTKLMSQCTIPVDETYAHPEIVRAKVNALVDEFLATKSEPRSEDRF